MKTPHFGRNSARKFFGETIAIAIVVTCSLLTGCAGSGVSTGNGANITASDTGRLTESGFLSDYTRLQTAPWSDGMQCWRDPALNVTLYDKVLISRIHVSLTPAKGKDAEQTIDPSDLKTLTDYFYEALSRALRPQMEVVDHQGPGVVVMRLALTDLSPTKVSRSVVGTVIPYAFIAEAGSGAATGRPAGATPYMGETGIEMQFVDGMSGDILGECRDTQVGRKYAADLDSGATGAAQTWAGGYLNSFQAWSYAKNAFDKWSLLVAQRFSLLRGDQR